MSINAVNKSIRQGRIPGAMCISSGIICDAPLHAPGAGRVVYMDRESIVSFRPLYAYSEVCTWDRSL